MSTQIIRNGEPLPVEGGYSWWHLNRLAEAIEAENPEAYDAEGNLKEGFKHQNVGPFPYGYAFKEDHTWSDKEENIWARGCEVGKIYVFNIKAGDVYNCWR